MEPMKPMKPMEPMKGQEPWWPEDLGAPDTTGSEGDLKYAYFADRRRLAVSLGGRSALYDTADHRITGVSQHRGDGEAEIRFSGPESDVSLASLKKVTI